VGDWLIVWTGSVVLVRVGHDVGVARVDYFDDPSAPAATGRAPGVVAAVRDSTGRLLLSRRVDLGIWVLPGGRIELGETIAEAVVREVREETGVAVEVTGFAGIYTDPGHVIAYSDGTALQEFSVTLHARAVGGAARADELETSEVGWFSPEELVELELHPVMRKRIADVLDPASPPVIA
jgi:8-oxo-dGTP pyrophosphatase MutT (NUDIX family)